MDSATKAIKYGVTTPQWLLDFADDYANHHGLTRSAVVTTALRTYLSFASPEEYHRRLPVATREKAPAETS